MDRDQLVEHLKFAGELGVTGISRDATWRKRGGGAGEPAHTAPEAAPITFSRNAAEALTAIRADIGDCTRCKLHTLGRTEPAFGGGSPPAQSTSIAAPPDGAEDTE